MSLTKAFYEAVSSGNILSIRIMMKDSLLVDPTFSDFNEMNNATRELSGLYDEHDGRELKFDKNAWNDTYLDELMVQIVGNFSHERVQHLKDVVKLLYPVENQLHIVNISGKDTLELKTRHIQTNTHSTNYQKQKYHDQQNGSYRGAKIAGGAILGATGGAILGATGGAIAGVTIGAITGAVTGAAIIIVATKG